MAVVEESDLCNSANGMILPKVRSTTKVISGRNATDKSEV